MENPPKSYNIHKDDEKDSISLDICHSNVVDSELDGIHDDMIFPTEEERATLRRVADTVPWNAYRKIQYFVQYKLTSFSLFCSYWLR